MSAIRILHISDLHWSEKSADDLKIVVTALIDDVQRLRVEKALCPDIIIFSGDLAQSGDDQDMLQAGFETLILPLAKACGLEMSHVFLAPGNHDISRSHVRTLTNLESGLRDKLITNSAITKFARDAMAGGEEHALSLRRMDNFYAVHDIYRPGSTVTNSFLRTFKINVGDRHVGVACFNSAWRATGEKDDVDRHWLVVGEAVVDMAVKELEGCDFRVAVHHHPLDWLVGADQVSSGNRLRATFDLACCGHMHSSRPQFMQDPSGSLVTSQTGSIYAGRSWFNGYQIIEADLLTGICRFTIREYHDTRRRFDAATTACDGGTFELSGVKRKEYKRVDRVALFLRTYKDHLLTIARDQIDFADFPSDCPDKLLSYFIPPPLFARAFEEVSEASEGHKDPEEKSLEAVLKEGKNVVFLGERQCGKSSLAYNIAVRVASGEGSQPRIPVYIDFRQHKSNRYGLRRAILSFYGPPPPGFDLDLAIDEGLFLFIVDNFNISGDADLVKFAKHASDFKESRWICLGTPTYDGVVKDRPFNEHLTTFSTIHIRSLPRKAIRQLATRWSEENGSNADELYQSVIKQLTRDGLPRTPYMVSLLLWAIHQKRNLGKINEAILLSNVIDHLLGKADFRQAERGTLNPIGKEITLQNLAMFLREKGGYAGENDVTAFLLNFFERKRLAYVASDVLDKLVYCGIISRDGDAISFKYDCFQEYFVAAALGKDNKLLRRYLEDLNFLEMRRELELLAGLRQENEDIIVAISDVLEKRVPERFEICDPNRFDSIAARELKLGTTRSKLSEIRRTRLTNDQVDEMMDEIDRRAISRGERPVSEDIEDAGGDIAVAAKRRERDAIIADSERPEEPMRPGTHMAAVDLLARVVKNSDFTDYEIKGPATKRVLESWVRIFLLMLDELHDILRKIGSRSEDRLDEEDMHVIEYIMAKFLFGVIGSATVHHLSSPTMAATLHSLDEEGRLTSGERMMLLFILEDIDDHSWQEKWRLVVSDDKSSGFLLEVLIDRLWRLAHSKALSGDQSERIVSVVSQIEHRLGWSNNQKSSVLQEFRDAATLAKQKENV